MAGTERAAFRLSPTLEAPGRSRARLREIRSALEPRFDDVNLVLSELVTNSVRHGGDRGEIRVEIEATPSLVLLQVSDDGPGFAAQAQSQSGLGLRLVDRIADEWGVKRDGPCTVWVSISKEPDRMGSAGDEIRNAGDHG